MSRVKAVMIVMLALLCTPLLQRGLVEAISLSQLDGASLACADLEDSPESAPSGAAHQDLAQCVSPLRKARMAAIVQTCCLLFVEWVSPQPSPPNPALSTAPPELQVRWQFSTRAALKPRTPSFLA